MGSGKAYPQIDVDAPMAEIVTRLTRHSMARMLKFYERSVSDPQDDPEDVHQLRVYCRRLSASIDSFRPFLQADSVKKLKRTTRQVRRAAGHARDMDVALEDLRQWSRSASPREAEGVVFLAGWLSGARALAQETLEQAYQAIPPKELWRVLEDSLAVDEARNTRGAFEAHGRELVVEHLGRLIDDLTTGSSLRDLHEIRVDLKRLRYTLELFGQVLEKGLSKSILTTCRELQDDLGTHQDAVVAVQRLKQIVARVHIEFFERVAELEPGLKAMIEFQQERASRSAEAFEQQAPILTDRFRSYQAELG
jgi:CHAD domain-containing protein